MPSVLETRRTRLPKPHIGVSQAMQNNEHGSNQTDPMDGCTADRTNGRNITIHQPRIEGTDLRFIRGAPTDGYDARYDKATCVSYADSYASGDRA